MRELFFHDAMCAAGMPFHGGNVAATPEALLAEMDYYGIDRALVRHVNLDAAGAVLSNRVLADFLRNDSSDRLHGVWCILPEQCDELPEPDEFFRSLGMKTRLSEHGVGQDTIDFIVERFRKRGWNLGESGQVTPERVAEILKDRL